MLVRYDMELQYHTEEFVRYLFGEYQIHDYTIESNYPYWSESLNSMRYIREMVISCIKKHAKYPFEGDLKLSKREEVLKSMNDFIKNDGFITETDNGPESDFYNISIAESHLFLIIGLFLIFDCVDSKKVEMDSKFMSHTPFMSFLFNYITSNFKMTKENDVYEVFKFKTMMPIIENT